MNTTKDRKIWHLKARDFDGSKIYAEQDWRFQMFFEYLRISPSYALATTCKNVEQLAKLLGDSERAAAVWKTYIDVGNVYEVLYRQWWLKRGIILFGVHSARPRVEKVQQISKISSINELLITCNSGMDKFINTTYKSQGMPNSLLVSIPLNMKRASILKQLKLMLDEASPQTTDLRALYKLEENKMQQRRLILGLRLVYMKAARPKEALWRVASRAKISQAHHALDPNANKKTFNTGDSRRKLTIMASRLMHDSLVIAENAAMGKFPSIKSVHSIPFDFSLLGKQLQKINNFEKLKKEQMLANKKAAIVPSK